MCISYKRESKYVCSTFLSLSVSFLAQYQPKVLMFVERHEDDFYFTRWRNSSELRMVLPDDAGFSQIFDEKYFHMSFRQYFIVS